MRNLSLQLLLQISTVRIRSCCYLRYKNIHEQCTLYMSLTRTCIWINFVTSFLFLSWIIYEDILQRKDLTCQQLKLSNYSSVAVISSWTYCSVASSLSQGTDVNCAGNSVTSSVLQRRFYIENFRWIEFLALYDNCENLRVV